MVKSIWVHILAPPLSNYRALFCHVGTHLKPWSWQGDYCKPKTFEIHQTQEDALLELPLSDLKQQLLGNETPVTLLSEVGVVGIGVGVEGEVHGHEEDRKTTAPA